MYHNILDQGVIFCTEKGYYIMKLVFMDNYLIWAVASSKSSTIS